MAILLLLVPISLVLLGLAVWAFVWAVREGQYDDLDSPAIDILRSEPADAASPPPRRDALVSREAGCRERPPLDPRLTRDAD